MENKQTDGGTDRKPADRTTTEASEEERKERTKDVCGRCSKMVREKDMAILCDICETWYHAKCEKIPPDVYKFMVEEEAGSQFTWHCISCKKGCAKLKSYIEKLEKIQADLIEKQEIMQVEVQEIRDAVKIDKEALDNVTGRVGVLEARTMAISEHMDRDKESLQDLSSRVERVEMNLSEMKESTIKEMRQGEGTYGEHQPSKGIQKEMDMNTVFDELNDKKKRENNIVVYNIPESDSNMFQERIKYDRQIMKQILNACGVHEEKMARVIRLGTEKEGRRRPVLTVLTDPEVRNYIFRNVKELAKDDNLKNFRVAYDLTRRERQLDQELLKKAKNLMDTGKGKHVVRGPPWNRRIVRVEEQGARPV